MPNQNMMKSTLIVVWSVILTAITCVMGAIPLNALRKSSKGWVYWAISLSLAGAFLATGYTSLFISYLSLTVLIGLMVEFEKKGLSLLASSFLSILLTAAMQLVAMGGWIKITKPVSVYDDLVVRLQQVLDQLVASNSSIDITADQIVNQLPSGVLMVLISACALALIFEKKIMAWQGILIVRKEKLHDFKLPESFIWAFMLSVAGAFLKHDIAWLQILSINIFNVGVLLYFLQGLAVVVTSLMVLKVGVLWRAIILALLVVQLFPLVSGIGIVDLWMNFRAKLINRYKQINDKNKFRGF